APQASHGQTPVGQHALLGRPICQDTLTALEYPPSLLRTPSLTVHRGQREVGWDEPTVDVERLPQSRDRARLVSLKLMQRPQQVVWLGAVSRARDGLPAARCRRGDLPAVRKFASRAPYGEPVGVDREGRVDVFRRRWRDTHRMWDHRCWQWGGRFGFDAPVEEGIRSGPQLEAVHRATERIARTEDEIEIGRASCRERGTLSRVG